MLGFFTYVFGFWMIVNFSLAHFVGETVQKVHSSYAYDTKVARVIDCSLEKNATMCARPIVRQLLDMRNGRELMNTLETLLPASQCHYLGHVVGQQSFVKYQAAEEAMDQCNRACDTACVHGIIGEAFIETLGLTEAGEDGDMDFRHLGRDEIALVGKRLCASPETCHGVGHALFQIYERFEPALKMCREVSSGDSESYCYNGLFMEYADILYSRNMRSVSNVTYPEVESLPGICMLSALEERRACFRYFPRMVVSTLERNGYTSWQAMSRLREICEEYARADDRIGCTVGIGVYFSYSLAEDPRAAVRECLAFPTLAEQASCNFGQISVATVGRQKKVVEYCAAVPNESLRADCYQAAFYFLHRLGVSVADTRALCKEDICTREVENYAEQPGTRIRAYLQ